VASDLLSALRMELADRCVPTHTEPRVTGIIQIHKLLIATPMPMVLLSTVDVKKPDTALMTAMQTQMTEASSEYVLETVKYSSR